MELLTLTGHLKQDPELRHTPSGRAVVEFKVHNTVYNFKTGGTFERSRKVVVWGTYGETIFTRLMKGDTVLCTGRPQLRVWTPQDGEPKAILELVADNVTLIEGKQAEAPADTPDAPPMPDDDIPF